MKSRNERDGKGNAGGSAGNRGAGIPLLLGLPDAIPGSERRQGEQKSATAALWYIVQLMKYPEANLLVVRAVYATLRDSCFAQLLWAIRRLKVESLWQAAKNPLELTYRPTGQKILFRGFDNPDKLASATVERGALCWVWIEEAFEIASEAACSTSWTCLSPGARSLPAFQADHLTFNPWNGRHWLKSRFFDQADERVFTLTTTYRTNEFLDECDRAVFERMRRENPRRYDVAGLGNWGTAEGLIYENWTVEPFDPDKLEPEGKRCVFGLDYGYTNDPTAFIGNGGVSRAENAVCVRRALRDPDAQRRHCGNDPDERIREGTNPGGRGGTEKQRRSAAAGHSPRRSGRQRGRTAFGNGIARLQEYRLIVHPRCIHTAEELAAYVWDADESGPLNRPVDSDNHLMDAMRYAMEDIRPLRPDDGKRRRDSSGRISGGIRPDDLSGGWN